MSKRQRSKVPLLVIMAGGLCFALGRHTLGLILSGIGAMLFVLGSGNSSSDEA
jgi:hypothetical protein